LIGFWKVFSFISEVDFLSYFILDNDKEFKDQILENQSKIIDILSHLSINDGLGLNINKSELEQLKMKNAICNN